MDVAVVHDSPIISQQLAEPKMALSRGAPSVVKRCSKSGSEAWRRHKQGYETRMDNRFPAMLRCFMNPQSMGSDGLERGVDSLGSSIMWDATVRECTF